MIAFWLCVAVMLGIALASVMWPLLRRTPGEARHADRDRGERGVALTVALCQTALAEVERDFRAGLLSAQARSEARDDLQRRLIEETRAEAHAAQTPGPATRPVSIAQRAGTAAVLLALLPTLAVTLYMRLGEPLAIAVQSASDAGALDDHAAFQGSLELMVGRLAARLQRHAGDAQAWAMLARSYAALDRANDAVAAYQRAIALAPRDASLLADYADAQASANDGDLNGAAWASIRAALALDPREPKALALAGSAAFDRHDYPLAIHYWEQLEKTVDANSQTAVQARRNIAMAARLEALAADLSDTSDVSDAPAHP
ncbi:c-type cytochrome biogenesis protein CcmI [Paraburkholderia sp. DHOC27]|uniref:c-type cytochrome biogenesis protein CcmI n=1 Tax=Paraburkholderia sp. DHOC27 TaxID=2303330 RepID=UPI000E3D4E09|nr:c-type cytochrome biogenesis protein CcmI [Paraburkholderia sp. DHOC27]RFU49018.1 c-type cytochrome biogenesis protein CcmI [Paraburkholderia sp. DHOC27]